MSKSGLRRRKRLFEIIEVGNDLDPVSRSYDFISVGTIVINIVVIGIIKLSFNFSSIFSIN